MRHYIFVMLLIFVYPAYATETSNTQVVKPWHPKKVEKSTQKEEPQKVKRRTQAERDEYEKNQPKDANIIRAPRQ